jgi:hypothetical protein
MEVQFGVCLKSIIHTFGFCESVFQLDGGHSPSLLFMLSYGQKNAQPVGLIKALFCFKKIQKNSFT